MERLSVGSAHPSKSHRSTDLCSARAVLLSFVHIANTTLLCSLLSSQCLADCLDHKSLVGICWFDARLYFDSRPRYGHHTYGLCRVVISSAIIFRVIFEAVIRIYTSGLREHKHRPELNKFKVLLSRTVPTELQPQWSGKEGIFFCLLCLYSFIYAFLLWRHRHRKLDKTNIKLNELL